MHRMLIVDDDAKVRMLIRQMLEPLEFEIDEATDGRDALRKLREQPVDLVLCDLFMPEKCGIELLRELPHEFPDLKMIAMSGGGLGGRSHMLGTAKLFGAAAILEKPFDQDDLLKVVREILPPLAV